METSTLLPYDVLYPMLADIIGENIHQQLVDLKPFEYIDPVANWDAVRTLSGVSKTFRAMVAEICEMTFGPRDGSYADAAFETRRKFSFFKLRIPYAPFGFSGELYSDSTLMNAYSHYFVAEAQLSTSFSRESEEYLQLGNLEPQDRLCKAFYKCRGIKPRELAQPLLDSVVKLMQAARSARTVHLLSQELLSVAMWASSVSNTSDISIRAQEYPRIKEKLMVYLRQMLNTAAEVQTFLQSFGIYYPKPDISPQVIMETFGGAISWDEYFPPEILQDFEITNIMNVISGARPE